MTLKKPFLLFFIFILLALPAFAEDVIYLEDGGKIRGTIKKITKDKVVIMNKYGIVQVVHKDSIQKIVRGFNPQEEYKKKRQEIERSAYPTAEDYYALGEFCEKNKELKKYARDAYQKAIERDPNHPQAREKLGFRRHEGKWISRKDYRDKILKGFVKIGDQWVRKEDLGRAKAEEERKEKERLRQWAEWKKKQDEERGKVISEGGGPSRPLTPPKIKVTGYVNFKEMFRDTAQDVPWNQAHVYESKYYKITSNTRQKYIKVYAIMLDKFFEKYVKVFRFSKTLKRRLPVYIYANHQQFMSMERKPPGVGGFFQWGGGGAKVVAYHGTFGQSGNTFTVLAHECTHQFENLVLGGTSMRRTPMWIIEGLAVFFESAYYDVANKKVIIGTIPYDRLGTVKRMIRRGNYIRIQELIRTGQAQFTAIHYAHAWSIIYWMVYTNSRNRKIFMKIWETCKQGGLSEKQLKDIIKVDFGKWEEVWKDWVMKLK